MSTVTYTYYDQVALAGFIMSLISSVFQSLKMSLLGGFLSKVDPKNIPDTPVVEFNNLKNGMHSFAMAMDSINIPLAISGFIMGVFVVAHDGGNWFYNVVNTPWLMQAAVITGSIALGLTLINIWIHYVPMCRRQCGS